MGAAFAGCRSLHAKRGNEQMASETRMGMFPLEEKLPVRNFVFIVRGARAERLGLSEMEVSGVSGPTLHNLLSIKHLQKLAARYLRQIRHLLMRFFLSPEHDVPIQILTPLLRQAPETGACRFFVLVRFRVRLAGVEAWVSPRRTRDRTDYGGVSGLAFLQIVNHAAPPTK